MLRRLLLASFVLGLSLFFTNFVLAQGVSGIRVQPAIVEQAVEPGEVITEEITVTNQSDEDVVLYIRARNIEGLYETGLPRLAPAGESTGHEFASWVTADPVGTPFGPRETRQVRYRITIPEDASPGGHFGVLFMSRNPPDIQGIQGIRLGLQVGTVFNLRIAGTIIEDLFVAGLNTDKSIYSSSRPQVTFTVDIENRGNVLTRPQGVISITTITGKQVATVLVNESASSAFPEQERTLREVWDADDFTIGRYQAVLSLVYGTDARRTVTVTTSFWVLPVKVLLGLLALMLSLAIGSYVWMKVYIRRRVQSLLQNTEMLDRAQAGVEGALPPNMVPAVPRGALIAISLLLSLLIFLMVLIFFFA